MKKIFSLLISLLTLNQVYAYNPFEILHKNEPDFIIKEISQEKYSDQISANICNIGANMDQYGTIAIGVQNINSGKKITTIINNLKFNNGNCLIYRVGKVGDLGINNNGNYRLKGQVKIKYYINERDYKNNYLTSNVNLSTGTYFYNNSYYNQALPDLIIKNLDYFDKTTITEYNSQREIYNAIVAEVCNVGTTFVQNGSLKVNFRGQNNKDIVAYINSYNSMWYSDECRKVAINANDIGIGYSTSYNVIAKADDNLSINERDENNNSMMKYIYIPYKYNGNNYNYNQNNNTYYCDGSRYVKTNNSLGYYCDGNYNYYSNTNNNSSNNYMNSSNGYYCEGNWNWYYNANGYYCKGIWYNRDGNYNNNSSNQYYCNGSRYNYENNATSYYCNGSRYTRNNNNYNSNNIDIKLESITTNNYSKRIYANICNIGGNMQNYYTIKATFYSSNTGKSITERNSLRINNGGCSTNEISINYSDLGIYYNGNLSINVRVEIENYSESNASNNERTDNIQINF